MNRFLGERRTAVVISRYTSEIQNQGQLNSLYKMLNIFFLPGNAGHSRNSADRVSNQNGFRFCSHTQFGYWYFRISACVNV